MPIIKGIKFACEPCIRGHRSSKCNHSDRVLVQVRKPGRPLSSCPHTLSSSSPGTFVHSVPAGSARENGTSGDESCGGVNCSCDVTSVAIPKIASCACGTSKPHEPPPRPPSLSIAPTLSQGSVASHSNMIASPMSPTSPIMVPHSPVISGSTNRISKSQRPKKRTGTMGASGDGPARRASFIGEDVALELLLEKERERSASTESVKMEKTGSCCGVTGILNGSGHINGQMNGHGVQGFVPVFPTSIETTADQFHPQQHQFSHLQNARVIGDPKQSSLANENSGPKLDMEMDGMLSLDGWSSGGNETSPWAPQTTPKKPGGCCANKPSQPPPPPPPLQHQHIMQAPPSAPLRNCGCNRRSVQPSLSVQQAQQQVTVPIVPFPTQFYTSTQYPPPPYIPTANLQQAAPVWSYPASTINHPLTPQELAWLQQQRAAGVFGHSPTGAAQVMPPVCNNVQVDSWAHTCNCGPNCDCLGCATHPFNRRTVEYVKGIQQFMEGDHHSHSHHPHSRNFPQQISQPPPPPPPPPSQQNGFRNNTQSSPSHPSTTTVDTFNHTATSEPLTSSSCCGGGVPHSQEEHTIQQLSPSPSQDDETGASGTPSGTDNGGELSPSAFFYVDYPFGTCAQTEAGCKCGEGCTCVGCLTHGGHDGVVLDANVDGGGNWGIEDYSHSFGA